MSWCRPRVGTRVPEAGRSLIYAALERLREILMGFLATSGNCVLGQAGRDFSLDIKEPKVYNDFSRGGGRGSGVHNEKVPV